MATETGGINLTPQVSAAQQATNYLTTITGTSGISVHSANDTSNYINITSNTANIVTNGESRIRAYIDSNDNNAPKIRIGTENAVHSIFSSNGMDIFNENSVAVASFSSDGIQIGKDDESHLKLDYHSLQLIDREQDIYLYISDLRDENGEAELVQQFYGDGSIHSFTVDFNIEEIVSIFIIPLNGTSRQTTYEKTDSKTIVIDDIPNLGEMIKITYITKSSHVKAFTFGKRSISNANIGAFSFSEGMYVDAEGSYSHAEGFFTQARNYAAHAEGNGALADGNCSHAEGYHSHTYGDYSHAEGYQTGARGNCSHSEGYQTSAYNDYSHAEGYQTDAYGNYSHAEGYKTSADGWYSHAEGYRTNADGWYSHAEGYQTTSKYYSHAEGYETTAKGQYSHTQNKGTIASSLNQTALGSFNIEDTNNIHAVIIGNGSDDTNRSNAATIDWNGKVTLYSGNITDSTAPLTSTDGTGGLFMVDINGTELGYIKPRFYTNGMQYYDMGASREINGSTITHGLMLGIDASGKKNVTLDFDAWRSALQIVNTLTLKSPSTSSAQIDTSTNNGATSSSVVFGRTEIKDKNGTWVSTYGSNTQTDGQTRSYIGCNNMKTDGTTATNYLNIGVNKDGSAFYGMTSPTAFRNAINALSRTPSNATELPNCTSTSSVYPIVLGNTFANNGEISYMSPANFRKMLALGEMPTPVNKTTSVANSSNVNVASISLSAGTWVVCARVTFPNNSTGRRAIKLSTTSLDSGNPVSTVLQNPVSSAATHISTTRCFNLTSTTTVYLIAWQNSGGALSCVGDIEATRVG